MYSFKKALIIWKYLENLIFLCVFGYIFYYLISGFSQYFWATIMGKGFFEAFSKPYVEKRYYECALSIVCLLYTSDAADE